MIGAGRIVVSSARGFGEGVVGIIYLLEFLSAGGTFRGVGGDAVRVRF